MDKKVDERRVLTDAVSVRTDPKGSGEVSASGDGTCKAGQGPVIRNVPKPLAASSREAAFFLQLLRRPAKNPAMRPSLPQGRPHRLWVARLPVIHSRMIPFDDMVRLAVRGPVVTVGERTSPRPFQALSYAPPVEVASTYRAASAELSNIGDPAATEEPSATTPRRQE